MKSTRDKNKVTIIGAGFVGATTAFSLLHQNVVEEVALIDVNKKLLTSQIMDLQHALPVLGYSQVKIGDWQDIKDSTVVVFACGCGQKTGQTRLALVQKNASLVKEIIPKVFKQNPKVILVMITNPVDILTALAIKLFPQKKNQIMGTGTILDSMRFRFLLGEYLNVDPKSVHAYIVGEHGDSELPLWSTASIGNQKITTLRKFKAKVGREIFLQAKNAAYAIIEGKQATYYGIGAGAAYLINSVVLNKRTVLPVSHFLDGDYGLTDVCLSMPVIVGESGIMERLNLSISAEESHLLKKSAVGLKKILKTIN